MELCLEINEESTESLWIRIKGRAGTGAMKATGLPQATGSRRVDDALYRYIGAGSHSKALVVMGDFSHLSICARETTAGNKQCWILFSLQGGTGGERSNE